MTRPEPATIARHAVPAQGRPGRAAAGSGRRLPSQTGRVVDLTRPARFELLDGLALDPASRLGWVDAVEDLAVRVASVAGLEADAAFFLGVALREAVVNAIRHGTAPDGSRRVTVTLHIARGCYLVLTVRDRGRGFEPARLPDPLRPENLGRGSGRGIFYIRRFADRVSFSFPRHGGTVVRIEKRLPAQPRT